PQRQDRQRHQVRQGQQRRPESDGRHRILRRAPRSRRATGPSLLTVAAIGSRFEGRAAPGLGAVQPYARRVAPVSVRSEPGMSPRRRWTMRRTVQDVMTRNVVAVQGPTPFKELVRLLNEHRITALPVLDDTGRVVVGVVSETDLALKEVAPLREAHTPVFETAQRPGERAKAAGPTP